MGVFGGHRYDQTSPITDKPKLLLTKAALPMCRSHGSAESSMSRVDVLRRCVQQLKDNHSSTTEDMEGLAAIMDCSLEAAHTWHATFGMPCRSLTATRVVAEQVGVGWQDAMNAAAHELRDRRDWTLDEAAPYALIWILERLIERQLGANDPPNGQVH